MLAYRHQGIALHQGDVRAVLATLPPKSVQTVATSPPYWGLRDYGTPPLVWGGDSVCLHEWGEEVRTLDNNNGKGDSSTAAEVKFNAESRYSRVATATCLRCAAWRGSLGLEPTPDLFVAHLVDVFRLVRDVLADDGTCWIVLGDSFFGGGYANHAINGQAWLEAHGGDRRRSRQQDRINANPTLKPKDLRMIPARVALALQADGWYLRSEIVWHKNSVMPESVTDRCTRSHEMVYMLTKSSKYFYDAEAVREPLSAESARAVAKGFRKGASVNAASRRMLPDGQKTQYRKGHSNYFSPDGSLLLNPAGRNRRTVWTINPTPFKGAHFAVFPNKLVEPMVLAGASERGVCPACGLSWKRVVKKSTAFEGNSARAGRSPEEIHASGKWAGRHDGNAALRAGPTVATETTGWVPTCTCAGPPAPVPAVVLDPFAGSGTTLEVARSLGRHAIGIELNPAYVALAIDRLGGPPPPIVRTPAKRR